MGLFGRKAQPPVEEDARMWIESSMHKLIEMFGESTFQNVTVLLPNKQFFPDTWSSPEECVEKLYLRACAYLPVDRSRLQLEIFAEVEDPLGGLAVGSRSYSGAAGYFTREAGDDRFTIAVKLSESNDVIAIVATIAHELGHFYC